MKTIFLSFIISIPVIINAQGFQVNLQGQKQQGMGGAATALPGDGAALFFNPGSVSFLKENSLNAGASAVVSNTKFTDNASSAVYKTKSPVGFPFTGYLVAGKKESKLKYGLAVYTPFGSAVQWEDAWAGRFVITRLKLNTVYFQPTVSYKISDKIGIGAGFVYGSGSLSLDSDLPITDEDGNYSTLNISGKGHGYGFNAGIYLRPTEALSFGINYRSALKLCIKKGNARFNVPADMSANFPSGKVATALNLPQVITAGTAYKPSDKLVVAFDATMVGWNVYDTLNYDFENNTAAVADIKLTRQYRNTYSYRLGGEYSFNKTFSGRLGLKYLSSPVQDGRVTPEVPDASHFSYSTGFSYRVNSRFSADGSFTFEHIRRTDANPEVQLNGKYETYLFIPGLSFSYYFK
jgi:long-chain fatty acid transport protein